MNNGDRNKLLVSFSLLVLFIITSTLGELTSINRLENRITELNKQIETQDQHIDAQNEIISQLQTKVSNLEPVVERQVIQRTVNIQSIKPDWDSGWIPIEPGQTYNLTHNQGFQVMVYLLGWDYVEGCGQVIHQTSSGGCFWNEQSETCNGLQWCCSCCDHISIHRNIDDKIWDEFRVLLWNLEI